MTPPTRVLVAHQPAYLPWGGYFSRLLDVDELILLDHVQFVPRGPQRRNVIRAPRGGTVRLGVPVHARFGQTIDRVRIADEPWARQHWRALRDSYHRAPYWDLIAERLHAIYHYPWTHLVELNIALIRLVCDVLELNITLSRSSDLAPEGTRTAMLIGLVQSRGASRLRVGPSGPRYLDRELLAGTGINVEVATYTPPTYEQGPGPFTPALAALDTLMWAGPHARDLLENSAGLRSLEEA